MAAKKNDFIGTINAMQESFKIQHQQMIDDQKQILDEYKDYFCGVMERLEHQQQEILDTVAEKERQEAEDRSREEQATATQEKGALAKEIGEISDLLNEAVKTCSMEIPGIISQLISLQETNKSAATTD